MNPIVTLDWTYNKNGANQSLLTKVNEVSGRIHKITTNGGGNIIKVSKLVMEIFKPLEYVRKEDDKYVFSGRYTFVIDEEAEPNTVKIINTKYDIFGKVNILNYE